MAISKKGFRKIVVSEKTYGWKFNEKILVVDESTERGLLTIDFGWYDMWLYANDAESRPPDFEPKVVTPSFVRESILFANSQGWNGGKMAIAFKDGKYHLVK